MVMGGGHHLDMGELRLQLRDLDEISLYLAFFLLGDNTASFLGVHINNSFPCTNMGGKASPHVLMSGCVRESVSPSTHARTHI